MADHRHSETSEKALERYLVDRAHEYGARALKYFNANNSGYPDRLVVFKGGYVCWCELKSLGERPRPLQSYRISVLRDMGHHVYVADSKEKIDRMLAKEDQEAQSRWKALMALKREES